MNKTLRLFGFCLLASTLALTACSDDSNDNSNTSDPYVLCLGVTSSNVTSYYAVTTSDLMSGTISPRNNGVEQTGYRDFEQGAQTIFSIGGLGVTNVNALKRSADGNLQESGTFVFANKLSEFGQTDNNTMVGIEIPTTPTDGNQITFYKVDINSAAITSTIQQSIAPLSYLEWPSITGLCAQGNKLYVTYCLMNPTTYETAYTDTTYVAVYSYPELQFQKLMKDTRTGPAGSWNAFNGIFKVESGDMYIMSNSAIANGYSQSTKNAAFLRIPSGSTEFDSYYFDFETKSGGLKPAHVQYIGNGLAFVEVSTNTNQTMADRWKDANLKSTIVDLNNQTITDITGIPKHDGNGGRRFTAFVEGGMVYYPVSTPDGIFIYRTDPATATAVKGAKIDASFVGGFFRLN